MLKNECKHSHSQPFSPCIPNYCRVIHNTSLACGQEKKPLCSVTSQTTDVAQSIEGSVGLKLVFNWKDKSGLGEARCPWARLQWSCPVASGSGFNVWNRVSVNRAFLRKNRVLKRNLLNKTFKYDCRCLSQELFPILHTDCMQYVLYTNCYCIIFWKKINILYHWLLTGNDMDINQIANLECLCHLKQNNCFSKDFIYIYIF